MKTFFQCFKNIYFLQHIAIRYFKQHPLQVLSRQLGKSHLFIFEGGMPLDLKNFYNIGYSAPETLIVHWTPQTTTWSVLCWFSAGGGGVVTECKYITL